MACPKGGSHKWRPMRAQSGAGGVKRLEQCGKCYRTRDTTNPVVVVIFIVVVIILTIIGLLSYYKAFSQALQ